MNRVGEVIEAGTTGFTAQSYELYGSPPLGSLVKTGEGGKDQFGIVYYAETVSIEPGRKPIARGRDEAVEADIYRSNPQLLKLLRTEFSVLVVGHCEGDSLNHYLPSSPPHIHSFVYLCETEEVKRFSSSFAFLQLLATAQLPVPVDEVTAAALRQMSRLADDQHKFLVAAGKELSGLLAGDFNRLRAILWRIKP